MLAFPQPDPEPKNHRSTLVFLSQKISFDQSFFCFFGEPFLIVRTQMEHFFCGQDEKIPGFGNKSNSLTEDLIVCQSLFTEEGTPNKWENDFDFSYLH